MSDRPILFSGAMIEALLAGRKTQTRRIQKAGVPYAVGDRLWVRETWKPVHSGDPSRGAQYRADRGADQTTWKPGIHMFRWASRLTLTVTEVRVQRLQEITEADALAEGIERIHFPERGDWGWPQARYRDLWDRLNGKRAGCAWSDNPFIVAVSFTVERRNIDA